MRHRTKMKFSRLIVDGKIILVVEENREFVSVADLLNEDRKSVDLPNVFERVTQIREELKKGNHSHLDLKKFSYAPAVGKPGKIICVGLNYRSHVEETERKIPEHPVLFSKYSDALAGHLDYINIPGKGLKVDYEGELGVMIGKTARDVNEDFKEYIFGYFIGNDISSRELQYRTTQYLLGKSLEGFYPNGPSIVTSDEVQGPQKLWIKTVVNGEVRQNSNTSNMIFSVEKLVSYISHYFTLYPGDVISTGTPDGVVLGMKDKDKHWLKAGDTVEVSIEGLGTLKNTFK
ncbi:MAG: fumarylacetoacetate hydrolase family protein [Thermoplasmatales archaeon]|nr:fumarylacetoacetate hydrolase family protein [Thermoplasmatales archaeon]